MEKLSITFYTKKDKQDSNGNCAVYLKLSLPHSSATLSTKIYVNLERWQETRQMTITRNADERQIRFNLGKIEQAIHQLNQKAFDANRQVTAQLLKELYLHPERSIDRTLHQLMDFHTEVFWAKVKSGQRSEESFGKYKTVKSHVIDFIKHYYKASDIVLTRLNYEFIERLDLYLRTEKLCGNNTTVKYIQFLRSVVNTGIKYEWLDKDPFTKYDGRLVEVETRYLTEEELKRIENKEIKNERLRIIRDTFVFSCYTGFAPCDVAKLTWQDLTKRIDGNLWIIKSRQKTKVTAEVPVLPPVLAIIEKYKNHPKCILKNLLIPYNTNATLNAYLKELGDICGLDFDLHFYVARHTFATTVTLLNGVSIEAVSKMLGHKRITQTQTYSKVVADKVGKEMQKVFAKFETPKHHNDSSTEVRAHT